MNTENELKNIVAKNLSYYRKNMGLTQLQLAEKLNYSDKAISKWERGENIPDIYILSLLAELYGITLNDFVCKDHVIIKPKRLMTHTLITLLSYCLSWFVTTLIFVILQIVFPEINKKWLAFIYAIPLSTIILIVFSFLWSTRRNQFLSVSFLCWTLPIPICLTFPDHPSIWLLFVAVIPFQVLVIFWFLLRTTICKKRNQSL